MAATLTAEEQTIRQAGMQVFGVKVLAEKVETCLRSTYRQIRSPLSGWKSYLQSVHASPLKFMAFVNQLQGQASIIGGTQYANVKALPTETKTAVETASGYPAGFIDVACKIIDDVIFQLAALNDTTTVDDLQTLFHEIETEFTEEPKI